MDSKVQFVADLLATDIEDAGKIKEITKDMTEDGETAVTAAVQMLQAVSDEIKPGMAGEIAKLFGYEPTKVNADDGSLEKHVEKDDDMSDEIKKALAEKDSEIEAINKRLREAEEREIVRKYTDEASDFVLPSLSTDEIGGVLRAIDSLPTDKAAAVRKSLAAVSEVIKVSKAFEETGSSAEGATGADKFDAIAKQLVADGKAPTYQQGYVMAMTQNPEHYNR